MSDLEPAAETSRSVNALPISRTQGAIIIALLFCLLAFSAVNAFRRPPASVERFEYKLEDIPDADFTSSLNKLGAEGWEVVFARRATSGSGVLTVASYEMIFKRPR